MRIFANPNYNFIKWRWHALIISMVIIWAGVASIYLRGGMSRSIDFTGGTQMLVEFKSPTSVGDVRKALDPIARDVIVQEYKGTTGKNQVLVRLPMMEGAEDADKLEEGSRQVKAALTKAGLGSFEDKRDLVVRTDIVGPIVGADLQLKGILATVGALVGMLFYIMFRFRFTFAVGAIVATFHDILITLVLLNWMNYELSLNVIAAILTITGYSVNDTIVVFDRVRENQRLMRREPLDEIVNKSVNQTLGRTVITSGATFLAVFALYMFGGEVLRGFAFTMLVGVVTGTYSTVFIAASIAIILSRRTAAAAAAAAQPATSRRR